MLLRSKAPPSASPTAVARRFLWRYRHLFAALCLASAAAVAVHELRPPAPPSETIVVVVDDVPAGTRLSVDDVRARQVPADSHPDTVVRDVDAAIGRPLAVGLDADTALLESMLVGPGLAEAAPPGTVVVPVPVADDASAHLAEPGRRVDLVAATSDATGAPGEATVVARDVVVLAVLDGEADGGILGDTAAAGHHLYVAADERDATVLVGSGAWAPLRAILPNR